MADPHVKKITIYNLSNRIVFIEKDGNPILNNSIGFLPGEEKNIPTGSGTGNTTITIKDNLPGNSPKDHFYVDSKTNNTQIKYSEYTDATASIVIKDDCVEPHYISEQEDYTDNHIRYVEVKNRTGGGYTVKIKVCYTKPGENEKTYETGRFPIAQSKKVDLINGLNLPTGTKVRIEVVLCSSGKSNAKGSEIFYVHELSNRNAYYELLATWGKTKDLDFKGYR